jgi:N-acetylmuramoyl-L-alanine amidase CwlA
VTYEIRHDYIKHGNARPGTKLVGPLFAVAHDIGNGGSTAKNNQTYFNNHQPSASAHVFIDDKDILVIVPMDEKAWHVQYQKPMDNILFGDDANDAAIGVELCWGGKINFIEAYKRYVWFFAWLCKKYKWDPYKKIVSHKKLDPERRTDPDNALNKNGVTWEQFINDVAIEMKNGTISIAKKEESFMLEKAIVVNAFGDSFAAEPLAKRLKCPIFFRDTAEQIQVAKTIYVCGGSKEGLKGNDFVVLTGPDRWEAAKAIGDYTKKV